MQSQPVTKLKRKKRDAFLHHASAIVSTALNRFRKSRHVSLTRVYPHKLTRTLDSAQNFMRTFVRARVGVKGMKMNFRWQGSEKALTLIQLRADRNLYSADSWEYGELTRRLCKRAAEIIGFGC